METGKKYLIDKDNLIIICLTYTIQFFLQTDHHSVEVILFIPKSHSSWSNRDRYSWRCSDLLVSAEDYPT